MDLPAPRVRQRVSRLRRHFHARWLALGAAGLLLLVGAGALSYRALETAIAPPSIAREPLTPLEQARLLRQNALQRCAARAYPECIAALDQAKALDPSGESASAIREARAAATSSAPPRVPPSRPAGVPPFRLPTPSPHRNKTRRASSSRSQSRRARPRRRVNRLAQCRGKNALPGKPGLPIHEQVRDDEFPSKASTSKKR